MNHEIEGSASATCELVGTHSPTLEFLRRARPSVLPFITITTHLRSANEACNATSSHCDIGESEGTLGTVECDSCSEIGENIRHRLTDCGRASLRVASEVFDSDSTSCGVGDETGNCCTAAEFVSEIHQEHESSTVIGDSLIPPAHAHVGILRPLVGVLRQRIGYTEAKVCGHVCSSLVYPEILVRITSIMEQMLEFVSEDGIPPTHITRINEKNLSRTCNVWVEVSSNTATTIDLEEYYLDLAIIVDVR